MVAPLLLTLALAADSTAATVLVRRTGVSATEAALLTRQVSASVAGPAVMDFTESQRRLSMFGLGDATTCGGKSECHAEVGRQLGVQWLVLVSVSQIAQDQSLALELLEVTTEEVRERDSVLLPRRGEVPSALLERFAARVAARVARKADAPVATTLVPRAGAQPDPLAPQPQGPSRVRGLVLGGLALAALGAGVGLLVNGLSLRAEATRATPGDDGWARSDLSYVEAAKKNDAASVNFGIAGALGAVGVALGTTAVVTW